MADVYDGEAAGGVVSAKRFVECLSKHHDILIVTTGGSDRSHRAIVPGFYPPFGRNMMAQMGFVFARPKREVLLAAIRDADIVHVQFPFLLGVQAVRIANELGKPVVSGCHVQPENLLFNVGIRSKRLARCLNRLFVRTVYSRSDAVICPSKFARDELLSLGLRVRSHVISNGLMPQFHPIPAERDPEFGDRFVILSVGRLAKEKRHDVLIDAIALSKYSSRIQLVITGRGSRKKAIVRMARKLAVPARIGYVTDEELIDLYNTADLYIHASEAELEGMSVLEAIGCGLPALISDSDTSASKQFALNDTFLFDSNNPHSLAAKIDHLIENPDELKRSSAEYLNQSKGYLFEESVRATDRVYRECLSGNENGPTA